MNDLTIIDRLAYHANMLDDPAIRPENGIVFSLWKANRSGNRPPIEDLCRDVLNCLESANTLVNSPIPSSEIGIRSEIDSNLTYAVSTIIDSCQEYNLLWERHSTFDEKTRRTLREATWKISHGWCAILAGDIDSIIEHVSIQGKLKELIEIE